MFNYLRLVWLCSLYFVANCSFAQSPALNPWTPADEKEMVASLQDRAIIPLKYQSFQLDYAQLTAHLEKAPMRFSENAKRNPSLLKLPLPDGSTGLFKLVKAPIMHPDLAAKYPKTRVYAAYGVDDPTAYAKLVKTSKGFHGMILTAQSSTVYIDPYAKGDKTNYMSYYGADYERPDMEPFHCHVNNTSQVIEQTDELGSRRFAGDCDMRTYRLALACTGEYARYHGGTKATVMDAYAVTMARVNGVLERELGITTELIPNNDVLIFLNGQSDPYNNSSGSTMLGQNQETIDDLIGSSNYDLGHVFSTGGGGIARLRSICDRGNKARGVTGLPDPIGDRFNIGFVCHEMGHQLGGNHTFNSSCSGNRNAATGMEPGGGSTIMGYARTCSPTVQDLADDYYHAVSLGEINTRISEAFCGDPTNTGNNPPEVDAGADYIIPAFTPFTLTAQGMDIDDDALTYCWEQMDNGLENMPPESTSLTGPMFRSLQPVASPSRTFPDIETIVGNASDTWEVLPGLSRLMNFRVTIRDNAMGNGCTGEDDLELTVNDEAGPFLVLNPNTIQTWLVNDTATVKWDVAKTDLAPISCELVDILLSTDGGYTYPDTLVSSVANSGQAIVFVPNKISDSCRVKVVCATNVFFDISNFNFKIIEAPTPQLALYTVNSLQSVCGGQDAVYPIRVNGLGGLNEPINFRLADIPSGANALLDQNSITPSGDIVLTVNNLENVTEGLYDLKVIAEWSGQQSDSIILQLQVFNSLPPVITLSSPTNGSNTIKLGQPLTWEDDPLVRDYQIDIASSPSFEASTIVESAITTDNNYIPTELEAGLSYYWRIRSINNCGFSPVSGVFGFQLLNQECIRRNSGDVPKIISSSSARVYESVYTFSSDFLIQDVNINMDISHSNIGDLIVQLVSPNQDTLMLFDRPGFPATDDGCEGSDIQITMDDQAEDSANKLETTCKPGNLAISGSFQSIDPLSILNGQSTQGKWVLIVEDVARGSGGFLDSWSIDFCYAKDQATAPTVLNNARFLVVKATTGTITNSFLQGVNTGIVDSNIQFILSSLPANGLLLNGQDSLTVGSIFTQSDINNDSLNYQHDGSDTSTDQFTFDLRDTANGWLPNQLFEIGIIDGNQAVGSVLETSNLLCNGDSTATIRVFVLGGTPPYEYSLNNGSFQTDSTFNNLSAGDYTVTIKDANSMTSMTTYQISEPSQLELTAVDVFRTVTISAMGGTGALTYSLNGSNFQTDNVFNNVANGNYTVSVKDINDCIATTDLQIAVPVLTADTTTTQNIRCFGLNDGLIEVLVTEGVPPYEYNINGSSFSDNNLFSDLSPGSYTVRIRDSIGQLVALPRITLSQPDDILFTAVASSDSIFASASGGSGQLEYSIDGSNYQTDTLFVGLADGVYEVSVKDENDCIEIIEVLVGTLGFYDPLQAIQMDIFPNPNDGTFRIQMTTEKASNWRIRLYDQLGRVLYTEQQSSTNSLFDHVIRLKLPASIYYLEVSAGTVSGRAKVVIRN